VEDAAGGPRYVQLVFDEPSVFLQQLAADSLAAVQAAVRSAHPDCSLGVIVMGLKSHIRRCDVRVTPVLRRRAGLE
jgi:hypothetical protein